jgi:hypothetical protein
MELREKGSMVVRVGDIGSVEVPDRESAFEVIFGSKTYPLQRDKQGWQAWERIQALNGGSTLEGSLGRLGAGLISSFLLGIASEAMLHNRQWLPPCTSLQGKKAL